MRAYAKATHWNTWSFAHVDIRAQRRIANERVMGQTDDGQELVRKARR